MDVYQSSKTAEELEFALGAVPSIGENGNWFVGDQDTGVFAGGVDVTGAEVGQTIVITEVDANGVPTAWKAANYAGGVKSSRIVADITIDQENIPVAIEITTDMDGNSFAMRKFIIQSDINTGVAYTICKLNYDKFNNPTGMIYLVPGKWNEGTYVESLDGVLISRNTSKSNTYAIGSEHAIYPNVVTQLPGVVTSLKIPGNYSIASGTKVRVIELLDE